MRNGIHYKMVFTNSNEYRYEAGFNEQIHPQYQFTISEKKLSLSDLVAHNQLVETSPNSPFVQHMVVKIATPQGLKKLIDNQYTLYQKQGEKLDIMERVQLSSLEDYCNLLKTEFSIVVPPEAFISSLSSSLSIKM